MGFIDRIKTLLKEKTSINLKSHNDGSWYRFDNDTLANNETVFSAVSMLSGAIASLPISLRDEYNKVKPAASRVAELLEFGVNPNMTTFNFIRCLETLRDTTGAGYAIKDISDNGQLNALWLMKTHLVKAYEDEITKEIYYKVKVKEVEESFYIHNSYLINVSHISDDGINPINPIDVLKNTLEYDREVKEFSINQMQNGIHANLVFKFDKELSEEQLKNYNNMIRSFKKHGVLYLDKGKQVEELRQKSFIDPQVFDVENITIARVARVFNLPLDKFLPEKSSYNSAEQSDLNYLRDTILPLARMYEQEFSRKLLSISERMQGLEIKFSLNGFARADMETRGKFYTQGMRNGFFCPDDIRALEDLPPIPEGFGKTFYVSKDLTPIELSGKGKNNE